MAMEKEVEVIRVEVSARVYLLRPCCNVDLPAAPSSTPVATNEDATHFHVAIHLIR